MKSEEGEEILHDQKGNQTEGEREAANHKRPKRAGEGRRLE